MSFKLLAIRPLEGTDPKFLKNLRPNYIYKFYNDYHFLDKDGNKLDEYKDDQEFIDYSEVVNITKNETVPQNLYGDNINISALVGKNGSGKSSLLEMLYHHISCFEVNTTFDNSEIEIFIEIEFNIYIIKSVIKSPGPSGTSMISSIIIFKKNDKAFFELNVKINKEEINKIKKSFFTNVINYSVYGLNETIGGEWLNKIFHKNDAYTTPITINPYRENGNIDVNKEYLLAQQRMILNHYVIKNKNILEGYKLIDINYTIDIEKPQIISYKNTTIYRDKNSKSDIDINENINKIKYINTNLFIKKLSSKIFKEEENRIENFVNLIFNSFDINNYEIQNLIINRIKNTKDDELFRKTSYEDLLHLNFIYIIKKLFKISDTYEKYRGYYALFEITLKDEDRKYHYSFEKSKEESLKYFTEYLNELKNNNDHITFKLKQSLRYFETEIFNKIEKGNIIEIISDRKQKYIIKNYINDDTKIEDIPLALFDHEIIIDKKGKKIDFKNLSSGEQQKIHTILNVVYHAYNITSKNEDERYKNMNLIFDEVELYFHPEFQRTFISDLLVALKFFDGKLNFNILFSTHSPFILSDIPSQNILKLEDGKPKKDGDNKNSFGANIHDLLADEFFLKNGTMGAFANKKIKEIIDFLKDYKSNNFEKDYIKQVIDLVGEPLLRNSLLNLYRIKYREKTYEELLKFYEENAANQ